MTDDERRVCRDVFLYCADNYDHLMMSLIMHCIPWTTVKTVAFRTLQRRFASMIESFIRENNLGEFSTSFTHQKVLDKETFLEKVKNFPHPCPPGSYLF